MIQCFEEETLQYLKTKSNIPVIQLISYDDDGLNESRLEAVSSYADGIAPDKKYFGGNLTIAQESMSVAKRLGLVVTPYTFRAESK